MKSRVVIVLTVTFLLAGVQTAAALHGNLRHFGDQRVLHVWGSPYDMGYAHGYLLGDEIMKMMEVYAFPPPDAGPLIYDLARLFVMSNFTFSDEMADEARGMFQGMLDAGVPEYVPVLKRNFDADDLLVFSSLAEIRTTLCSTLFAWHSTTAADPDLDGSLVVAHNTDYYREPEDAFVAGAQGLVIAYSPNDPDRQRFISVTFPGMIGIAAAMNESGIGVIVNGGNYDVPPEDWQLRPKMEPGAWQAREAVSKRLAADGEPEKIEDVLAYYDSVHQFVSTLNQAFGPAERSDPPVAVFEINNATRTIRYPDDDPQLSPDLFLVLNWEDKLLPERDERATKRYWKNVLLLDYLFQREIDIPRLWQFAKFNEQDIFSQGVTLHSAVFLPEQMRVAVSYWSDFGNVPAENHQWYEFEDFFYRPTVEPGDDDDASDDDSVIDDDSADDDSSPGADDDAAQESSVEANSCGCG